MYRRAFTLIELLVTIVIIGLLATITVYSYSAALSRSRDQQRLTDLHSISNALEQYYLDHKTYPKVSLNPGNIISANFQLDKTAQLYDGVNRCTITNNTNSANFLTPGYMTAIPEDPQHKLQLSGGNGNCSDSNAATGEYTYITNDETLSTPHSYLLMAKLERSLNQSLKVPTITPAFAGYFNSNALCDQSVSDQANCQANYYLGPQSGQ